MTSSRSTASTSSWLLLALAILVAVLAPVDAEAGGRKRVVVLELEGPKAEKFHEDLVKLIKKTHTVVPIEKWTSTAQDLDAAAPTSKNIKKVAKKLKVDAVITGKIDKRRDEYLIKLKLREGKTGELVGNGFETKAEGPRMDAKATRDLKDELIDAIGNLDSNRASGGASDDEEADEDRPAKKKPAKKDEDEDEDEPAAKPVKKGFARKDDAEDEEETKPAKKPAKKDEDEEEPAAKPVKKGFARKEEDEEESRPAKKPAKKDEDEEEPAAKPVKKGFSRKSDDDEVAALKTKKDDDEQDEDPLPKPTKKKPAKADEDKDEEDADEDAPKKKVASKDEDAEEDGGSVEDEGEVVAKAGALSPGERAVDAVVGLSFNARRMSFRYDADLGPSAMGTGKPPPYKGVPVAGVLIDATVYPLAVGHKREGITKDLGLTLMIDKVIKISSSVGDPPIKLATSEMRYAIGAAFRHSLGKLTLGATLRYGRQNFTITPGAGQMAPDIPNVNYTIIDPTLGVRYQAAPKILVGFTFGVMAITNTGQIQKGDQYGLAKVLGFEGELSGDYTLTKNLFARASFKVESIGFTFRGGAVKTNMRDADTAQDVQGARDSYLGGTVAIGYLY